MTADVAHIGFDGPAKALTVGLVAVGVVILVSRMSWSQGSGTSGMDTWSPAPQPAVTQPAGNPIAPAQVAPHQIQVTSTPAPLPPPQAATPIPHRPMPTGVDAVIIERVQRGPKGQDATFERAKSSSGQDATFSKDKP